MNNPIQKRFNELVQKWTKAINTPNVKMIRIHAEHDEQSFVNDFFEYMLALDTEQEDLVFLLESPWNNIKNFSEILLNELSETIEIWNNVEKPESFSQEKVKWKANKNIKTPQNEASLFVNNINTLANKLVPNKDIIVSFVLKIPFADIPNTNLWLKKVIEQGVESHVRIGIADTDSNPQFNEVAKSYPTEVYTLYPNLDIDGAVEEMAAMGSPNDPETPYRKHLAKLMNAVKNRDAKEVEKNAKKCLDIASKNVGEDANWLGQIVLVYTTLYNDQIGYKNYKKALFFANKAVEAGALSIGRIESATAYRLYGQTLLGRGTILRLLKKSEKSCSDYELAAKSYEKCNDYIMQCESIRLFSEEAEKAGRDKQNVLEQLIIAFYLVDKMSPENITQSTYPWVVKKLYDFTGRIKVLSDEEMKEKLAPYFGDRYMDKIDTYGSVSYSKEDVYQ